MPAPAYDLMEVSAAGCGAVAGFRMKRKDPPVTEARSRIMRGNRHKNTKPELLVRRCLHAMGYRFRLHRQDLPGKPDIILPRYRTVIQVNGCFWHQHPGCKLASVPRMRRDYWIPKLARNVERDAASTKALEALGWRVITLWECDVGDPAVLRDRLSAVLSACS